MPKNPLISKHLNFHYAWVVLICSMGIIVLTSTVRQSFGVFIDPLVAAHGWSRGEVSLAYSALFICASTSAFGLGPLCERIGVRRVMFVGIVGFCAGVILLGSATALWQLYFYYGILCGGLGFLINIVIPVTITRWFARKVGLALGLMWASLGIGGMVGPVALRWLITSSGWRNTFFLVGTCIGSLMLLAFYFFRSRPQDMNMTAFGEKEPTGPSVSGREAIAVSSQIQGVEFGQIKRSPAFWHLINTHFLGCVGHAIMLAHIVSIAIFRGIPGIKAAGILGTISATSTISRLVFPTLTEKLGGKKTLAVAFIIQATPVPFLFLAADTWAFYAIAFFFGFGFGGEMPSFPIINRQYWGLQSPLSSIYAWEQAGGLIGMALGGWVGGALYDLTGNYNMSIITSFLFTVAGLAPILALPRHFSGVILAKSEVIKKKGRLR